MTTAAAPEYVAHTAGPMIAGVQRCISCSEVLADEVTRPLADLPPGSTRYARGGRVLLLTGPEYSIKGPFPLDTRLPKGSQTCST